MTELDHAYFSEYLHGLTMDQPDVFLKLAQLIAQNQFEWLPDGRVVYLMNDAVESFLVFKEAKMTGAYDPALEEETLHAHIQAVEDGYILAVHQGSANAFTIRFRRLTLEVHLYSYGEIGHFWVKGQEDLRQLEYRISILHDKLQYLGEEYTSEEEIQIAQLRDFPPIMAWLSVPLKYAVPRDEPWRVIREAIAVMRHLAREVSDQRLLKALSKYEKQPTKKQGKRIAHSFAAGHHDLVLFLLADKLRQAADHYPKRSFGKERDTIYQKAWKKACDRAASLQTQGICAIALREEPFVEATDELTYKTYVMQVKRQGWRKKVEVELVEEIGS